MELDSIQDAFLCKLDGGLAFGCIRVGDDADEKRSAFGGTYRTDLCGEITYKFFRSQALGGTEYESQHVGPEFGGEHAVFFAGDAADLDHRAVCARGTEGVTAFCKRLPELPGCIFAAAFEGAHDVFGERRVLGDGFAHEDSREAEATCVGGVCGAVDARFKDGLCRELVADACGDERVGMERCQIAGVDSGDNRPRGSFAEGVGHDFQFAQVVGFADFHEGLHVKALGALGHLHELFVVQDAGNQEHRIGTTAVGDVDFFFEQQKILAQYRASVLALGAALFHQGGDGDQVAERALEKVPFGQYRNRLGVRFGVGVCECDRVQVGGDVALRRRCALDFEDSPCVAEEFRVATAAAFRNLDAEVHAESFDIGSTHAYNL